MAWKIFFGCVFISLFLTVGRVAPAEAQVRVGPGATVFSQTWTPTYVYPYGYYGYGYPAGPWFVLPAPGYAPYASRYLPSYSYLPNPYAQVPGAAAYGTPSYTYSPNIYTYDLYSQAYTYPWGMGHLLRTWAVPLRLLLRVGLRRLALSDHDSARVHRQTTPRSDEGARCGAGRVRTPAVAPGLGTHLGKGRHA
jgi:hypothetical protein